MQTHEEEKRKESGKSVQATKSQASAGKFWCSSCGAEYARMFALRLHMKTAHGLVEEVIQDEEHSSAAPEDVLAQTDSETAVLIAAAEADAAYINAVVNDVDVVGSVPTYEEVAVEVG